jgi:hypothetical protein
MKQYRFTSENWIIQGESGHDDAVMDTADLARIKKLAGIPITEDYYEAGGHDPALSTPNDSNVGNMSPVGSNISYTGMEKRRLERENNIKPGSPEWFKLWFSRPYLTGEKPVGDAPSSKTSKK